MLAQLIAVGIALLLAVAVSALDVQEMAPSPEAIDGLKSFAGEGFEDVSEIINGFRVRNTRIPYYTYLLMYKGGKVTLRCGGSLIHDDIVLTAAHCLYSGSGKPWPRIVVFGALKDNFHPGNPFDPSTGQWRDVVVRYAAPNFNPRNLHGDVALLKLSGPFRDVIKPKLNRSPAIPAAGSTMYVVGYGNMRTSGQPAATLMAVGITNQAPSVCADKLAPYYEESIMICSNNPYKGTCYGDSGGPLVLPYTWSHPSGDLQVGIASIEFGGCADQNPTRPDRYARVSTYYELIKHFVCTKSSYNYTLPHFASKCDLPDIGCLI